MGQVFLQLVSEPRSGESILGEDFLEALFCGGAACALEDAADGASDIGALRESGDVSLSVLVEVELATLPRDGAEDGFACGRHPWVVFADDEGGVTVAEQPFIPDPFRADVEDEVAALATSTS